MGWATDFTESRRRLVECNDFASLRRAGHELKDGVVLTSVSDIAFEMSFRCIQCARVFWFENWSWRDGGIADWRLSAESCESKDAVCIPSGLMKSLLGLGGTQGRTLGGAVK
jgi:hypothetical protein